MSPIICRQTVNLGELILDLSSKFLVSETMEAELEGINGDTLKCAHLYRSLVKLGFDRIDDVLKCLERSQNKHIADLFTKFKESRSGTTESSPNFPKPKGDGPTRIQLPKWWPEHK